MRRWKWLLVFAAFALVVAACGDDDDAATTTTEASTSTTAASTTTEAPGGIQTINPGVLTVGSDIPWPPFEDYDDEGNVVGFDASLVDAMAACLGLETEWIDTDFDTIFTQLATGRFDVVASGTTITPERAEQVNFTEPYYNAQQALTINIELTPNIGSVDDLGEGDSVAVQTGTTGADWAVANLDPKGVAVREFPAAPDTYNALEGGQVTGVIFDEPSAVEEAGKRAALEVVQVIDTNEKFGFGVDPANPELLAALNDCFTGMIDDGTYQALYDEWFDAPAGSILYEPEEIEPPQAIGSEENPIQVLYVPSVSAEEIVAGGELLAAELNAATGLFFEVSVPTSYAATVEEMCASRDNTMGFIPAQAYVLANSLCGVDVELKALRFGFTEYWAEFIVPRDSDFETLEDLAGATWAYPDGGSTSGFIVPSGIFANLGIETGEGFEAGGHSAVVRAIYNEEADFGTVFFSPPTSALTGEVIWDGTAEDADVPEDLVAECGVNADSGELQCGDEYEVRDARRNIREEAPDVIQKVRILTISDGIPNDTLSFSPDFPADLQDQIVEAMKAYAEDDPDGFATAFEAYSWTGVADSSDAEFDTIRTILDSIGYDLENLG
jgi:phosphate/phosphite/phosphonate ABC transporter binding protein